MEATGRVSPGDQGHGQGHSESRALGGKDCCMLFDWLWGKSSAVLGTPTTAALIRRAISASSQKYPDLRGIVISRERLAYTYKLPDALSGDGTDRLVSAFQDLLKDVLRLTGELTGGVMVRSLIKSQELSPWLPDMREVDKWLTTKE